MKKSIFLLFIYLLATTTWARKPAITPQIEIANEYPGPTPSLAQGYSFHPQPSRQIAKHSTDTTTSIMIFILLGLPLVISATIMWRSKQEQQKAKVIALASKAPKDEIDETQEWKKAS